MAFVHFGICENTTDEGVFLFQVSEKPETFGEYGVFEVLNIVEIKEKRIIEIHVLWLGLGLRARIEGKI